MAPEEKVPGITLPGLIGALDRLRLDMDAVYAWHTFRDDSAHAEDISAHMARAIGHAEALRAQLVRVDHKRGRHAEPVRCCRHGNDPDAKPPCKMCVREREHGIGG